MALDNAAHDIISTMRGAHDGALGDDVIIAVHSDNGGDVCHADTDVAPWGSNWPLRGRKMTYFEGGVRVPAFVWSPRPASTSSYSRIPAGARGTTYAGLMHHVDWLPTFVALAHGAHVPDVDGVDQWTAIVGKASPPRTELVLDLPRNASCAGRPCGDKHDDDDALSRARDMHGVVAIREGDLKLILLVGNDTWYDPHTMTASCPYTAFSTLCDTFVTRLSGSCAWQSFMFNISADPDERNNLIHEPHHAEHSMRLHTRASELMLSGYVSGYEDDLMSDSTERERAGAAFESAGGYVVPWGCAA